RSQSWHKNDFYFSEAIGKALSRLKTFKTGLKTAATDVSATAKQTELFHKGVTGTAIRLQAAGAALVIFGNLLKRSENQIISFIGSAAELAGIIIGPVGIAMAFIISKVGDVIYQIGNRLVEANLRAAQSFSDLELRTFTFRRTVEAYSKIFPDVVSGTEAWEKLINKLNKATGTTIGTLQASASEIISATAAMGFNEDQMMKLLEVSVDYAAQIKGDTLQSTLDFISAMNGQSQSVLKYGAHMTATAVQEKLRGKGIRRNIASMPSNEAIIFLLWKTKICPIIIKS
ncbi:unnamed protein product, partial [marine sediment metagenome]